MQSGHGGYYQLGAHTLLRNPLELNIKLDTVVKNVKMKDKTVAGSAYTHTCIYAVDSQLTGTYGEW